MLYVVVLLLLREMLCLFAVMFGGYLWLLLVADKFEMFVERADTVRYRYRALRTVHHRTRVNAQMSFEK